MSNANPLIPPARPSDKTTLGKYLRMHGITHFSAEEVLTARRLRITSEAPDRSWWPRIIPVLAMAEQIRTIMGHPLVIGNGYRPSEVNKRAGGSRRSQHLYFRAIDIDLPSKQNNTTNRRRLYEASATMYMEFSSDIRMGLGFYTPYAGSRVHIDAYLPGTDDGKNKRTWGSACWGGKKRGRNYPKEVMERLR